MKIAILDDWFDTLKKLPSFSKLDGHNVTVFTDHVQDVDTLAERLNHFDGVILFRERTQITEALLNRLTNLKLISQRGVFPHVDVDACTKNNILLCSKLPSGKKPAKPNYAAIEHTWALILASYRQIPEQVQSLKNGEWQMGVGKTLRGRTLGLYGFGSIARGVEHIAEAFGMDVVWWASDAGRERLKAENKPIAQSREAFFAESDIVSLHVRLKPDTKGIITAKDLSCMNSEALLVNTSRAGLIETGALLNALNDHHPGFAAIDVFDKEPITWPNDELASHPNVVATPHLGFVTEDEFDKQFSDIYDQVNAYAKKEPINMINESVWSK